MSNDGRISPVLAPEPPRAGQSPPGPRQSEPARPRSTFYPELEAARGLAALVVVIFHVFVTLEPKRQVFETHTLPQAIANFVLTGLFNGSAAVTFFFVLSGFVLGISLDRLKAVTLSGYAEFQVRRLFRIMPAVWASIGLALLIKLFFFGERFPWAEISRMLMLEDIRLNGPLWSIKIELFATFFYPFLLFASRSVGIVFNACMLWLLVLQGLDETPFVFRYMAAFHFGILVPLIGKPIVERLPPVVARLLLVVAFAAFCSAAHLSRLELLNPKRQVVMETIASFYFVSFILYARSSWTQGFLNSAPLRWLGRISYSLYALHFPLHSLVFMKVVGWWGSSFNAYYPLPQLVALPFVVGLSLLAAWASWHWVERPFIAWGRPVARGAGALIDDLRTHGLAALAPARVPLLLVLIASALLIRRLYFAAFTL